MYSPKAKYIKVISELTKDIRLDRKLTQSEAGEKFLNGKSQATVSNLENGNCSIEDLLEYLNALASGRTRSRRTGGGSKRAGRVR